MINKVNSNDIISFIKMFFPQYKLDNNPYESNYVYKIGDKIVGFISYSIIYERAELNYIAVLKEYRNQGIAQKLFNYCLDDLKNNMVDNISLEVNVNNKKAISFYLKNSFEIVSTRKKYYNNEDGYLMVKKVR